ncbi:ATP-dependent helicase/nuclease subunit A [Clostridium acetireducens DSM 10703]|uniref:ATP-dependent helicase/nuclease subunit A n=1 Tax=Clostridium acetireducens DSM 10703 TaxID=1121290 RepID=A0A1E8EY31_9CLOT|nr:helicase-exonuclease AddAB subunit AddA [Clostridium acetireducens]OFI05457.1 ATP-dependent helicase/nuclease subunit A [Clostridium acetireducens DSM 10703]
MKETQWTEEQKKAIETRGCNLLVAAAAGSGKTAVLVERIIRKTTNKENPIDIDKLLIVTFTNAAASEMKERIGDSISKALDENPEHKQLQRQLALLNRANITTIHSFCIQVIRNNFHILDLDPNFRVADDTETILLKDEVLDEIFDEKYENEEEHSFFNLIECYAGKTDEKVKNMILNLYNYSRSLPWPEKWLIEKTEEFNVKEDFDFSKSKWAYILLNNLKIYIKGIKNKLNKAINIIEKEETLTPYLDTFKEDLYNVNSLIKEKSWYELCNTFNNLNFGKLKRCGKDADKSLQKKVKDIRDEIKKDLKKIKEDIFLDMDKIPESLRKMYSIIKCLTSIVIEFHKRYAIRKKERGIIDFNDIEHFCLEILIHEDKYGNLVPTETAFEYKYKFEEILIDEYQDSNMVQETILNSISKGNNIFMVGDIKQSIYRFRQAKPELFLYKYNNYSEEEGNLNRKIKLFKNFRSREEVINSVNYIFKQIMSKNIGELDYNEGEMLNLGASYKEINKEKALIEEKIELHLIDKSSLDNKEYKEENGEELDSIQLEAKMVVKRIEDLISPEEEKKFYVFDKEIDNYRPIKYRDIVVLMRTTSNWSPVFMEEMLKANIPVFADTNSGYFETMEVKTILSLLQIIDNPMQDIPLLSVLRCPVFSFKAEDIIDIRLVDDRLNIYEIIKKILLYKNSKQEGVLNIEDSDENIENIMENKYLINKLEDFMNKLKKWREISIHKSIDEFIWYLYVDTGYYGYVGAIPGGIQRQANLRVLFERAKEYEETSFKGLFNFVNFINKLKNSSGDMGSAKVLGENEDVVRIMSIHKSKGLEFPVVIIAGTGKQFNFMDMNKSILFHHDLGFGPDYINLEKRIYYPTIVKEIIKNKIKLETLSEEMRILYVAMTRAKEKLIITGVLKDVSKELNRYSKELEFADEDISEYTIIKGKSYLDWIVPAVMREKDSNVLREKLEDFNCAFNIIDSKTKWYIKIWKSKDIIKKEESEEQSLDVKEYLQSLDCSENKSGYKEEIIKRLNWKYKFNESSNIPAKISVSELKRKFEEIEYENTLSMYDSKEDMNKSFLKKPIFLEKTKKFTAAERGTLMHLVMQHIDLTKKLSKEEIKEQVSNMILKEFLTQEQSKVININQIYNFFNSDLGKRMLNSKNIKREVPFYIEISSKDIYKNLPSIYENEKIMLQGVIDCYFEEKDYIVLLDYKTDYVENIEHIKDKYSIQLNYYKKALERITGKSVKEMYIYLFFNDEIIVY